MGNRWWGEKKHGARFDVLLIIKIDPHRSALDVMHLEKSIVAVHGHVAPKETRQVAELVVMHLTIAVALIVDLADVDVRNWIPIVHHTLLIFLSPDIPAPWCTRCG
ncbi:hypothetical protein D3C75_747620 [compost metagenome]